MGPFANASEAGRALIELAADACLTFGADGILHSLSTPLLRLFGYRSEDELLGKPIDELIPGFDCADLDVKCAESGPANVRFLERNVHARRKDGTLFAANVRLKMVDGGGRPTVVAIVRSLVPAEEDLRDSQEMLRAVADSTTAVIYIKASDGRYILVNRRFEELFHWRNDALRGKTDHDFLPADVADGLRGNDLEVQRRGVAVEFDEIVPSDGESREYISLKVPLVRPSGEVYAVCGISTDITERKRNQQQLVEMYRRLQGLVADRTSDVTELSRLLREEADARADLVLQLSSLIAAASEGIWTIDVEGLTTFVNPRMAAMLGYTTDEMLGRPIYDFMQERYHDQVRRSLAQPNQGMESQHDFEFCRKDGSALWTWISANVIRNSRQAVAGVLCMLTDITDRKHGEEHQVRLLQELDHRVKNCLATVVALADLIMENVGSLAEFRASFASRMQAMARTHESLARARWQDVGFDDVIAVVLAAQRTDSAGVIRTAGEPVRLAPRVVTPLALTLSELGTNALKHGALSCTGGEVHVAWQRDANDRFELTWVEQGGPYVSAPTADGTGLGLMRGLIEYELGGTLAVEFLPPGIQCRIIVPLGEGDGAGRDPRPQ